MPSRNPERKHFARQLRRADIPAEKLLWRELRGHRAGFKFRRQHPIGPYFVDFACCTARVAIELDGESHVGPLAEAHDHRRTEHLQSAGWHVLRFTNPQVYDELDAVVNAIFDTCSARRHVPPSP